MKFNGIARCVRYLIGVAPGFGHAIRATGDFKPLAGVDRSVYVTTYYEAWVLRHARQWQVIIVVHGQLCVDAGRTSKPSPDGLSRSHETARLRECSSSADVNRACPCQMAVERRYSEPDWVIAYVYEVYGN